MLPFVSIVRFAEYDNGNNPLWKSKPAVMIDKVAKSTALRLAYPEQLGGIYDRAELSGRADDVEPNAPAEPPRAVRDIAPGSRTEEVKGAIKNQLLAARTVRPRMEIVDKSTPTPWERIVELCRKHGVETNAQLAATVKAATGKPDRKAITEDDVAKVEAALALIASPATVPEPAQAELEDAPF
jgi:hypothetical protein